MLTTGFDHITQCKCPKRGGYCFQN